MLVLQPRISLKACLQRFAVQYDANAMCNANVLTRVTGTLLVRPLLPGGIEVSKG